ncbi:MAG: hypothetical protein K0U20_08390 [Proteobacteria bacterium]|nr:hypothetical protein [Pseudomonadota bacterium]
MTEAKKKTKKVRCRVKKAFRVDEKSGITKRGEQVLSENEYNFAMNNNCLEKGV